MIIGFDAKRAFQNKTGLGNYSRTLISSLHKYFPENQYVLFAPRRTALYPVKENEAFKVVTPEWQTAKKFPSLWRSHWITRDLRQQGITLYHGLSNELPVDMHKTGIRSVVTIHDLIFERYPQGYDTTEVLIYRWKFKHACRRADAIIAASAHTKRDIVDIYNIDPDKVHVCYQGCNPAYSQPCSLETLLAIRKKYDLPENYFLYVGSIIERKNLLLICQALQIMKTRLDIPLVVIGEGKAYKKKVQQWLTQQGMLHRVIFLADSTIAQNDAAYQSGRDFPAIYQNARAFIYPSRYEGFGIPVLEGLHSGIPVLTAFSSSLPEAGGEAALYFNPDDAAALGDLMWQVAHDESVRQECKQKAAQHILQFSPQNCAGAVMQVYNTINKS